MISSETTETHSDDDLFAALEAMQTDPFGDNINIIRQVHENGLNGMHRKGVLVFQNTLNSLGFKGELLVPSSTGTPADICILSYLRLQREGDMATFQATFVKNFAAEHSIPLEALEAVADPFILDKICQAAAKATEKKVLDFADETTGEVKAAVNF